MEIVDRVRIPRPQLIGSVEAHGESQYGDAAAGIDDSQLWAARCRPRQVDDRATIEGAELGVGRGFAEAPGTVFWVGAEEVQVDGPAVSTDGCDCALLRPGDSPTIALVLRPGRVDHV